MIPSWTHLFAIIAILVVETLHAGDGHQQEAVDFQRDVRPILSEHCIGCHGPHDPQSGLSLTSREALLTIAESGRPAIHDSAFGESELLRRILSTDSSERMPPEGKKHLSKKEVEVLKAWILDGAKWDLHWSFRPIAEPLPPAQQHHNEFDNPIDSFIYTGLQEMGWTPSNEASRSVLLKRLSYDLLGLPPSIHDTDEFLIDTSPDAYERLVDKFLDSPHFGERWGRHWLDIAHYADSDGYEKDRERPDAFRFRDWVIQAHNHDLTFDEFTISQLAGDLLPNATSQSRLATAFLRQTLTNEEGGVDQEEFRVAACFDRTETVGTVWLGLTIGCVRCHGHKYDPIPHEDYYKLFSFFNNSDESNEPIVLQAQDLDTYESQARLILARIRAREQELFSEAKLWETETRQELLQTPGSKPKEYKLLCEQGRSTSASNIEFAIDQESTEIRTPRELATSTDQDTLEFIFRLSQSEFTGVRIYALADPSLPHQGPGLHNDGNFVVTGVSAWLIQQDGTVQAIEFSQAQADFEQKGFSADQALPSNRQKKGWAVSGAIGKDHWLQLRTKESISIPSTARLKLQIEHKYGKGFFLGKFRVVGLEGDLRSLIVSEPSIANILEMYPEKRVADSKRKLFEYFLEKEKADLEWIRSRAELADLQKSFQTKPVNVRTMSDALERRDTFVFDRGEFLSPTKRVVPGTPVVLPPINTGDSIPNRYDLAHWLVSEQNPLTPRVVVNQIWSHLFGRGIVRTVDDFGIRGEPPAHPQLLDYLASRFRSDLGWSRKALIRLIVTSSTYKQGSHHRPAYEAIDPQNVKLFRQNRFRVEAEVIRDLTLAVSGLLSTQVGGPSVFPPMPDDLAKLSYANSFSWKTSEGANRYRRGLYTFFKRTIPHPALMTFDAPDANVSCVVRNVSNTPLQSLALLNNESHSEAARALARRILDTPLNEPQHASSDDQSRRLAMAMRWCTIRQPSTRELDALSRLWKRNHEVYSSEKELAKHMTGEKEESPNTVELATWIAVARVLLNLDELLTRE